MGACVVLAAGASTRSGPTPKGLLPLSQGGTVVRHVVEVAAAWGASPLVVVLGAHQEAFEKELQGSPAQTALNVAWELGRTGSVKCGFRAAGEGRPWTLVWPVDHPFVAPSTLGALEGMARASEAMGRMVTWIVPLHEGRRGHPILVHDQARREVLGYGDDEPLFRYPRSHAMNVMEVRVQDPGVVENIDTPQAFEQARTRFEATASAAPAGRA